MTEITLVRHGQASFGSDDYDKLSELGEQQALWLGEYFGERKLRFDRVVIGSQLRHRQTAEGIVEGMAQGSVEGRAQSPGFEIHPGFNEYNFQALVEYYSTQYPEEINTGYDDRRHFYAILRKALMAWSEDSLAGAMPESWTDFCDRITAAMNFASTAQQQKPGKEKVLVVSSGGPISMIMKQTLELSTHHMVSLNLQVINSSFSRFLRTAKNTHLLSFNNISHLDQLSRLDSITYS